MHRHALGTLASLLELTSTSKDRPPCTLPQARLIGLDFIESVLSTSKDGSRILRLTLGLSQCGPYTLLGRAVESPLLYDALVFISGAKKRSLTASP